MRPRPVLISDREYIVDRGASSCMMGDMFTEGERSTIRPTDRTYKIQTADGVVEVHHEAGVVYNKLVDDSPVVCRWTDSALKLIPNIGQQLSVAPRMLCPPLLSLDL